MKIVATVDRRTYIRLTAACAAGVVAEQFIVKINQPIEVTNFGNRAAQDPGGSLQSASLFWLHLRHR
ncbi:hypothetical protein [Comamonas sp.]|uniref:hypothetical protein n=1 Tax=Comamonas sp. TaxID=34028 RepID=UPI00289B598C|nr:hypothetical protein [Comamonas sp.]